MVDWELKGWRFPVVGDPEVTGISVPDVGGQADMVPRDPAQLAWAEAHFEGIAGMRRIWATAWEVTTPRARAALLALWVREGGKFEVTRWTEVWSAEAWSGTLRRGAYGMHFMVQAVKGSTGADEARAWLDALVRGCPGLVDRGPMCEVTTEEGLRTLSAAWSAIGGTMGPELHAFCEP